MMIYFVSSNVQKHDDVARIFKDSHSPPRKLEMEIVEAMSPDLLTVVKKKAIAAYEKALVPLIVEHGALYIDYLNGLPGPLVKLFWEKLDNRLCDIIPEKISRSAHVVQMVCHCDGQKLQVYEGRVDGEIALQKRGTGGIHWEPMFVPAGQTKTFGEMEPDERIAAHATTQAYSALRRNLGL